MNIAMLGALLFVSQEGATPDDYRKTVFLAYTLVFACIIVYLVHSYRRNLRLRQDLEVLERRIRELEGKQGP